MIFLLHLLVESLRFRRLVVRLISGSKFQLNCHFAYGARRLINQLFIKIDGFLVSVKVAINRGQGELGQGRDVLIVGRGDSPELTFSRRVVLQLGGSET